MYHAFIAPNTYSDVDGAYTGADRKLHINPNATNYYTFSLWDTYRALHPLLTILQPEKVNGFMEAFLMHYNEYGLLPVWSLWGNETNTMIGYHAIPVIVDAYFKGLIREDLVEPLYNAMLKSAYQEIRSIPLYLKYGYIPAALRDYTPADPSRGSVSKTLEYAYDDWCIAQMAKDLGREEDYRIFSKRADSWRALFNKETKLMSPKLADGSWKKFDPFDASRLNDYTEANAFQYTWYVPHDVGELIDLIGGKEQSVLMLDSIFVLPPEAAVNAVHDMSGFIGQYVHGNEPSHHIAYLFNYAGAPHKTQEKVNQILNEMYSDQPDGLPGNEDCGQMSAWYIFSSLGLYPVNPANGKYDLGRPYFPEATN
jgi:predicted alpha-1,2-mannosidase